MQNSSVTTQRIKVHPFWWTVWTLAHAVLITICFLMGGVISYLVVGESDAALPAFALLWALMMGISLGLGQYGLLRLRHIIPPLIPWLLITTTTLFLGVVLILSGLHSWMLSGLIMSGLVSLGQWVLLRATLHAAGWWMLVTLVPWMVLSSIFSSSIR